MTNVIKKILKMLGAEGVVMAMIAMFAVSAFAAPASVLIEGTVKKFNGSFVWLNSRGEEQMIPQSLLGKKQLKEGMFVSVNVPMVQAEMAED